MGQYTKLLQLNRVELIGLKREDLYAKFYPNDAAQGDLLVDLDKSLPGIQFLLYRSKDAEHSDQGLLNGKVILPPQEESAGVVYHVLTREEIERVDCLLSATNESVLEQNFDPLAMTAFDVYPNIWNYGKESYDYLCKHFLGLKKFISDAAHSSKTVVVMTT